MQVFGTKRPCSYNLLVRWARYPTESKIKLETINLPAGPGATRNEITRAPSCARGLATWRLSARGRCCRISGMNDSLDFWDTREYTLGNLFLLFYFFVSSHLGVEWKIKQQTLVGTFCSGSFFFLFLFHFLSRYYKLVDLSFFALFSFFYRCPILNLLRAFPSSLAVIYLPSIRGKLASLGENPRFLLCPNNIHCKRLTTTGRKTRQQYKTDVVLYFLLLTLGTITVDFIQARAFAFLIA